MNRRRTLSFLAIGLAVFAFVASSAQAESVKTFHDPKAVVDQMITLFNEKVDGRQAFYLQNEQALDALARQEILPYFDTEKMAKFILGRAHWGSATEEEKTKFVEGFTNMLMVSYSTTLLNMKIDKVEVGEAESGQRDFLASVSMKVYQKGDPTAISVRNRLVKSDQGWKLYDVSPNGISLLVSFRKTYAKEVDTKGLQQVIDELLTKYPTLSPSDPA